MKKLFYSAVFASVTLVGCSESADIAEDVSFNVSAYLIDVLVEPPKVNEELQYKIVVDKLPDGEYKAVYNSDGKDSHVSVGTRGGQTYNQGTNFDISIKNSTVYFHYTGKNAGTHNIEFMVMSDEYAAAAKVEQIFVSDIYCYFENFSMTEFPFGYTPTAQFMIQKAEDESNEFYAEYEIVSGEEFNPRLSFTNLSVSEWMPAQKRRIGSGTINQVFEIKYNQELEGEVEIKIRISDKYGWEKENICHLKTGKIYKFDQHARTTNYTMIDTKYGGNKVHHYVVYLRTPDGSNAYAEEDILFCVWGDNEYYDPLVSNSSKSLPGKWIVGTIPKGHMAGAVYIVDKNVVPKNCVLDDSKSQLKNVVLHPSMEDKSWKYTIPQEYKFDYITHVGDRQHQTEQRRFTDSSAKFN